MSAIEYAAEKLTVAIYSLVTAAPIKYRLESAWMSFHTLQPRDLADDPALEKELGEILHLLTGNSDLETGRARDTINKLSDDQCDNLAKRIADLCFAVRRKLSDE